MSKDQRIEQMWLCALKYDVCTLKYLTGCTREIEPTHLKSFIKIYENYLDKNELLQVTDSNSRLTLSIDDRLPRFLQSLGIESIQFSNNEEEKEDE